MITTTSLLSLGIVGSFHLEVAILVIDASMSDNQSTDQAAQCDVCPGPAKQPNVIFAPDCIFVSTFCVVVHSEWSNEALFACLV